MLELFLVGARLAAVSLASSIVCSGTKFKSFGTLKYIENVLVRAPSCLSLYAYHGNIELWLWMEIRYTKFCCMHYFFVLIHT